MSSRRQFVVAGAIGALTAIIARPFRAIIPTPKGPDVGSPRPDGTMRESASHMRRARRKAMVGQSVAFPES